jgi:hypothetical protein
MSQAYGISRMLVGGWYNESVDRSLVEETSGKLPFNPNQLVWLYAVCL